MIIKLNNKYFINDKKKLFVYKLILFFIVSLISNYIITLDVSKKEEVNNNFIPSKKLEYKNKNFIIIERECVNCGLFSFYIVCLGCIHKYLLDGYIPIIDLKSLPNVINGFKSINTNVWDIFFQQPFGYTLENVLKYANKIKRVRSLDCKPRLNSYQPFDEISLNFWHNFAKKYSYIKKEIVDLSNKYIHKLFKNSRNILGVLTRGTDFISKRPKGHPIPPNLTDLISDVNLMDSTYKYDYIFFTTEDELIREKFIKNFSKKIKQIKTKIKIKYDYSKKDYLGYNKNVQGNIELNKIYLINIFILSKCLDLLTARCNGATAIFLLTSGFRYSKIYNLGLY